MDSTCSDKELMEEVSRSVFVEDIEGLLPKAHGLDNINSNVKYYDCSCGRALVALISPCTVHFFGSFTVLCLAGKVEVFGKILDPSNPPVKVFSYESFAALYMATVETETAQPEVDVGTISNYGISFMEATRICNIVQNGGCILLLENPGSSRLRLDMDNPHRKNKKVEIHTDLKLDLTQGVTVVCGGQNVGKSTSLRYLINRALNQVGRVLYLDLDPGQPEFTLHECVSAVLVEKPLFGPSYTHFSDPVFSFNIGNIDVSRCVETYLEAVELLVTRCRDMYSDIPWLVNTMGFSRGVGIFITSCCLATLSPSLVIQLNGDKLHNFPNDLSKEYVEEMSGRSASSYKLIKVLTGRRKPINSGKFCSLSNREIRHVSTQEYFSCKSRPSHPLIIPTDCIKVFNVINKTVISEKLYADLVGKLVTLSSSESVDEPPEMLDFGVILDYIESTESLVVLTPLEGSRAISKLSSILVGSLQFPSQLSDRVHPLTSGLVPFCQLLTNDGKPLAPILKPHKRNFRFLFQATNEATSQTTT